MQGHGMRRLQLFFAACLALLAPAALAQPPASPPLAAFADDPAIRHAVISPDGAAIAYVADAASSARLMVEPLGGDPVTVASLAGVDVTTLGWADADHAW